MDQIERFAGYYISTLQLIARDINTSYEKCPILSEAERRKVLYEWNDTKTEYPSDRCVHQLFEEQAARTPETTALVFEDTSLSYGELNRRANQLAPYLRELGVQPDDRVGLCVERRIEVDVGLL